MNRIDEKIDKYLNTTLNDILAEYRETYFDVDPEKVLDLFKIIRDTLKKEMKNSKEEVSFVLKLLNATEIKIRKQM